VSIFGARGDNVFDDRDSSEALMAAGDPAPVDRADPAPTYEGAKWTSEKLRELAESGASTATQRDALRAGLEERGVSPEQIAAVMAHTENAVILWKQDEPSTSWLGGPGLLPAGTSDWPRNSDANPFTPVAHFDLGDLPKLPPPFPQTGALEIYYDFGAYETNPPSFLAAGRAYLIGDDAVQLDPPRDIFREDEIYLTAALMPVAGEPERVIEDVGGFDTAKGLIDAMNDLTKDGLYRHQLGGRAREFQGDVLKEIPYWFKEEGSDEFRERYTEAERTSPGAWQLLATVEWEGDIMFGDGGNLYMVIPKADLREGRFDRAVGIAQGA
jgi:uncharacterized protein YwqG